MFLRLFDVSENPKPIAVDIQSNGVIEHCGHTAREPLINCYFPRITMRKLLIPKGDEFQKTIKSAVP
jgi:hypothetical protein